MTPVLQKISTLLVSRGDEIISREKDNRDVIYLYNVGGWWVAFECSAYMLSRLHMGCYPSVLRMPDNAECLPLVMDGLPEDEVDGLCRINGTLHDGTDYKAVSSKECSVGLYARWKKKYLAMSV